MSQYNTINLQKVVAESMKELFPDDDEDVFAEDREKYNSGEDIKSITERNTRVFANIADAQAQRGRRAVQLPRSRTQTRQRGLTIILHRLAE